MIHFGPLEIGNQTRIVGSATTATTIVDLSTGALVPACEVLEIRLDLMGDDYDTWSSLAPWVERIDLPVLLTIRSSQEGGSWPASEEERVALFEHALPGVDAIDIELRSEKAGDVVSMAQAEGKGVLVSYHDFDHTPGDEVLLEVLQAMHGHENVVGKIVTTVKEPGDVTRLEALLAAPRAMPLCVMGMGEKGRETRVSFARKGSCLTYGYIDVAAAPGQLSCAELSERLRSA